MLVGFAELSPCFLVECHRIEVNNILDYYPLHRENGYLLAGQSVDVLGFLAKGEPRFARKVDCFPNIETCAET